VVVALVITFLVWAALVAAAENHAPAAPTGLTVDDDAAPLAVTDDPAFGWLPRDSDRGEIETAYEIVVYDAPEAIDSHRVVDSQEVRSHEQSYVHVPVLGSMLRPNRTYWWTVRTWDSGGAASPYAPLAHFDTGLRDGDWRAAWIRRPGAEQQKVEDYSLFRKVARVGASPIVRARVAASAGHQYDLFVNGSRRAHGPSFAYPDEQYYETTDIRDAIKPGALNVFGFVTWWGQPGQGRPASVPALIAQITIDHADGSREVVATDGSWRTDPGPWTQGPPRNDEGDFVEHIDLRREPIGWTGSTFDDQAWKPAAVIGPAGTAPFTHLFAARTHVVEQRVKPTSFKRLANGAYIADFGAVIAATPVVDLRDGRSGAPVLLVGGDRLDPDGRVSRTIGVQDTNMTWEFDERAGAQQLRPFGYLAFRYLEVDGTGEALTADDVQVDARHASMPDEHAARFETSDSTLNAVWNLARHSALFDSQEQFLDTPTREKGAFLGDGFDVSQASTAAFGERNLTFQALRDFARSQTRYWNGEGRVNVVYPNGDGKRDIPDATETYVQWVWQTYLTTGSIDQLRALYPVVKNIGDYVERAVDPKTGLVTNLPGGGEDYLYGAVDWPPWMRYGYDMKTSARTMINVLAASDFSRLEEMARAVDNEVDAKAFGLHAQALALAIQNRLTRPDGVLIDGLYADGTQSPHASQQANAWALATGIVPRQHQTAVADYVISLGNAMGVVYFRELLDALHNAGRDDALVASLTDAKRPGYAQILKDGATFTWESWDAPAHGDSESHGWGSTVLAVLQDDILGVKTADPGASALAVKVPVSPVTRASGVVATQRGPVPIAWTRDASGSESIDVVVPDNVTASVHLPAPDVHHVSDAGLPVVGDPGVQRAAVEQGEVVLFVGSGHYKFANTAPTRAASDTSSDHSSSRPVLIAIAIAVFAALIVVIFVLARRRRRLNVH
jgi:alpha-L-rhamnosidase